MLGGNRHARTGDDSLEEAFASGGIIDLDVVPEVEGCLIVLLSWSWVLRVLGRRSGGQHAHLLLVVATRVVRRRQRLQLSHRRSAAGRRRGHHLLAFCPCLLLSAVSLGNLCTMVSVSLLSDLRL
jgi:hypothetical protein